MFEQQYDDEMAAEIRRLEGKQRAAAVGQPHWQNACVGCGCEIPVERDSCARCTDSQVKTSEGEDGKTACCD